MNEEKGGFLLKILVHKNRENDFVWKAADEVLSLFYPRRCPVCQDAAPLGAKICPECRRKPAFIRGPVCLRCGKEISDARDEYCPDCLAHERTFREGISLMNYDAVGRVSIQGFKYHGRREYGAYYIEEILARYGERIRGWRADAVVPVPCHPSRMRARGYNQAEILARELARGTGLPEIPDALRRTKKTRLQKKLGSEARRRNIESAIEAEPLPDWVRSVILTDDIYTTGATAEACTRALRHAGAQEVYVVTVCIGRNS